MKIDHIGIGVGDYERAKAFYAAALAPLGMTLLAEYPGEFTENGHPTAGFGSGESATLWLDGAGKTTPRLHIALSAQSRSDVDAFYDAAIAAGGADNGGPGLRPQYHPHYYAAFVLDLDGHNIEAVCRKPA